MEVVATPATSPKWMSAGSFRKSPADSNAISRGCWASSEPANSSAAARPVAARREHFITCPLSGSWLQDEFLHAPLSELARQNFIGDGAIQSVHRAELSLLFAGDAELADDLAVQLHLEDLAGDLSTAVFWLRVGVGGVEYWCGPGDTQGPGGADVVVHGLVVQVVVEHHDALVAAAAAVDIALGIHGDGMQQGELAGPIRDCRLV